MNGRHNDELTPVEAMLTQLRPDAGNLDRDRVLFEAGRASGRRAGATWSGALAFALVATLAGGYLVGRFAAPHQGGMPRVVRREPTAVVAGRDVPAEETAGRFLTMAETAEAGQFDFEWRSAYLALCREVAEKGPDALPPPPQVRQSPAPKRLLDEFL